MPPVSDSALRRLIPAVPALSRAWPLMWPLDLLDRVLCLPYREFRGLPPNHMRIRIGVGNRLLFNAAQFRLHPLDFWLDALAHGRVRLDSNIVDLGSGCGRYAMTLRDFRFHHRTFTGTYFGVDVDEEMLAWCRGRFPADRFTFHRVGVYSKTYNPGANGQAAPAAAFSLPLPDASQDFVFAISLFSHLLEPEFTSYLREAGRLLRPGGCLSFSAFCMEHVDRSPGSRWSFRHRAGAAFIESQRYPEAAVAYELEWIRTVCAAAGLDVAAAEPSGGQTTVICKKGGDVRAEC